MGKRGPKPGYKKAREAQAQVPVPQPESGEVKSTSERSFAPHTEKNDPDREELYAAYREMEASEYTPDQAIVNDQEEVVKEPPKEEVPEVTADEPKEEEEVQEATPEEKPEGKDEVRVEEPVKPPEVEKTVPLQALHEEREKRKMLQKRLRELEQQAYAQQVYQQRLAAQYQQPADGEISDYDKALQAIQQQNAMLMNEINAVKGTVWQSQQEREMERINTQITSTHQKLESEGFPHFNEMQDLVVRELRDLYSDDPENIYEFPDNPLGWSKVYRERVFPRLKQLGLGVAKEQNFAAKTELKKQAGLVSGSGKSAISPKDTNNKELTHEEYLKAYMKLRGHPD